MNIPSGARWLAGLVKRPQIHLGHDEEGEHEYEDDEEGAYHLGENEDDQGRLSPSPPPAWPNARKAGCGAMRGWPRPPSAPTSSRR
jgi:hypothetical protein